MNYSSSSCKFRPRIAWLFPSMARGFYWQPVLCEFTKMFPETVVFTGCWPGFASGYDYSFTVKVIRKTRVFKTSSSSTGYDRVFMLPSLEVVPHLIRIKPQVIFTSGFTLWTILVLLLKPWLRWRIVIVYDGSSPDIDTTDSTLKLFVRRVIVRNVDAIITNSNGGKDYLFKILGANDSRIFARPYQVPDIATLLAHREACKSHFQEMQRPIFLFAGQIIQRKGLNLSLEACSILQRWGYKNYTLLVVGDGPQRPELENLVKRSVLEGRVKWTGWVNYSQLGSYFRHADVLIFPTLADVWGMVVLEAMVFGMPILCSKWAGANEMVINGENGYIFDPYQPEQLAELMRRFIDNGTLVQWMGARSKQIIAPHTPKAAAKHITQVVRLVMRYD
ncbi:MAG: glycosyltransferase family 4 protein [Deltaproteobacteria bacterium]|nr:glycosyltransferase family 4 protein [Deltaproteobacteria bacterium]MBW2074710.1 glycosyltransferase family 4 protein [Deltaproteobacteria bacterium]